MNDDPLFYRDQKVFGRLSAVNLVRIELVLVMCSVLMFGWLFFELGRVKVSEHQLKVVVCQLTQAVVHAFPREVRDPQLRQAILRYDCPMGVRTEVSPPK